MPTKIRVVVKTPGQPATIQMIDSGLAAFQKIVGGYIEAVRPWPNVHAYVNEEGKLQGLAPNFALGGEVVVGPAVFSKSDDEGEDIGFQDESEAEEILHRINAGA